MPLSHPQTLQNIADKARVSRMSVSRALRGDHGVSAKTRARILQIAESVGYRPNPLVSTLMATLRAKRIRPSAETGTVLAYVVRADSQADARMEHFRGAAEAAEAQGYRLEPFLVGNAGLAPARLNGVLLSRNICGLVIAPLPEGHGHFALEWERFYAVAIEYTFDAPSFDRVVHDSYAGMRVILDRCRKSGFSRVGLLFAENARERTEGLNEAAFWLEQKSGDDFAAIPPLCLAEPYDEERLARWFDRHKPEAIVTSGMLVGPVEAFLRRRRITFPDKISIANVNTLDERSSGISQDRRLIGATAVQLVVDKIRRNDRGVPAKAVTVMLPGAWVPGITFKRA